MILIWITLQVCNSSLAVQRANGAGGAGGCPGGGRCGCGPRCRAVSSPEIAPISRVGAGAGVRGGPRAEMAPAHRETGSGSVSSDPTYSWAENSRGRTRRGKGGIRESKFFLQGFSPSEFVYVWQEVSLHNNHTTTTQQPPLAPPLPPQSFDWAATLCDTVHRTRHYRTRRRTHNRSTRVSSISPSMHQTLGTLCLAVLCLYTVVPPLSALSAL